MLRLLRVPGSPDPRVPGSSGPRVPGSPGPPFIVSHFCEDNANK